MPLLHAWPPLTNSDRSWRLKIDRAKQHLAELENELRVYSQRHPYRIAWERQIDPCTWASVLRITEDPSPALAMIVGDVVHNVRSALDHLIVAITENPNNDSVFPIYDVDPWSLGTNKGPRERFKRTLKKIDPRAVTILKRLQPYAAKHGETPEELVLSMWGSLIDGVFYPVGRDGQFRIYSADNCLLSILNQLDIQDKHCAPILTACALPGGDLTIRSKRGELIRSSKVGALENEAPIDYFTSSEPSSCPDTAMDVEIRGSVIVTVDVGDPPRPLDIMNALGNFTRVMPGVIFPMLEPFVIN